MGIPIFVPTPTSIYSIFPINCEWLSPEKHVNYEQAIHASIHACDSFSKEQALKKQSSLSDNPEEAGSPARRQPAGRPPRDRSDMDEVLTQLTEVLLDVRQAQVAAAAPARAPEFAEDSNFNWKPPTHSAGDSCLGPNHRHYAKHRSQPPLSSP